MNSLSDFIDSVSVWLGFNVDSAGLFGIVFMIILVSSSSICFMIVYMSKHKAEAELANYGRSSRRLNSFVCKVCLHRSYAESHIRDRYCSRCDKFYPEQHKVWKFPEGVPAEYPLEIRDPRYSGLHEAPIPSIRKTSV